MKKIAVNDLTLRDIFQNSSLHTLDMQVLDNILENYPSTGFNSVEVLGGSTFENMLENYFYKSPFQICSYINKMAPSLKLQVQIGARNLVGEDLYPKDIIDRFISQCIENGIESFRVYDALNDLNDIEYTAKRILDCGAGLQGTIIYDYSRPIEYYNNKVSQLTDMGCSSICIKDVESTLFPSRTAELFKSITSLTSIPIFISGYNMRGIQILNYFQACLNGGGGVDLSFLPSSYQDSSPTIFAFLLSLRQTGLSHNLDWTRLIQVFENVKKNIYPYLNQSSFSDSYVLSEPDHSLLPKWLISAISRQLKEIGEVEKADKVIEEIIRIKQELGNPSLATPIGQIIASQAILNTVISDKRWEIASDEIKKFLNGYYGLPPQDMDSDLKEKILRGAKGSQQWEQPPVDLYQQCENELKNITGKQEHVLSYCFFPEKTVAFLNKKQGKTGEVGKKKAGDYSLDRLNMKKLREITDLVETSNIENIDFEVDGVKISINKSSSKAEPETAARDQKPRYEEDMIEVKSPIVGTLYRSPSPDSPAFVQEGQPVKKGDTLCIIEAMKLMNKITADYDGTIERILAKNEQPVEFEQTIMVIRKGQ
ncbi:MAG: hypothetical protein K9H14_02400 [Actinomycetia bacterium]|nr:hypothetical protein [Actinomycetes bacterium]